MSANDRGAEPDRKELEAMQRLLDEVAKAERSIVEQSKNEHDAPGLDRVEAILERAAGARASPRPRPRWLWLAAAVVVAALGGWWIASRDAPSRGPAGIELGGLSLLYPSGTVDRWDELRWTGQSSESRFDVRVLEPSNPTPLLELKGLRGARLALDAGETARWPSEILIEIDEFDAEGDVLDRAQFSVRRSSP